MKRVEISISQGRNDHRFIINGETVYEGDVIANFVHKSFDEWKDVILQELYENCNDEFCIYLSSGEDEFRYIDAKRRTFPKCTDIIWNGKSANSEANKKSNETHSDSDVWDELDKLYAKRGKGLKPTTKITLALCVSEEAMRQYTDVINSITEEGFSSGSLSLKCPYHNFVVEEIEDYDIDNYEGLVFFVGECLENYPNVVMVENPKKTGKTIKDAIAKKYIAPFLENYINTYKEDSTVDDEAAANKVNLTVEIPEKIDVGKSQLIGIVGMPKLKALEILSFEMSEPGILRYDRGRLFALAPGNVEVRVKVKGKIEPVKRCMVEAIDHIYVQNIELNQSSFSGTVGDVYQIKPIFRPSNAENIGDVKFESLNPRIAAVGEEGLIELYSTGKTKIRISVGEVETYFTVASELKITKIVVSNDMLKLTQGESQAFYVHVEPACYNADNLEVSIDNDAVSYEKGIIKANNIGVANITFKSPNSKCEAKAKVIVISSNYVLARRALQTGNYADAVKFYEQIRLENPNDWESNFFAVYSKAFRAEIDDITRTMELIMSSMEVTFNLIYGLETDTEKVNALTSILSATNVLSQELAQRASNAHAQTRTGSEHLESRGRCGTARHNCAALNYFAANTVEDQFLGTYPQLKDAVVSVWKVGVAIDVQTLQYASGQGRNVLQSDITTITQSIRRYEPSYDAPRPTGSDSTFMDYVSFFL